MGIFYAFLVVILLAAGIYLFGYVVRNSSLLFVLFLETVLGILFIFPLLFFVDGLELNQIFTTLGYNNWAWLIAAAIFGYIGGNYFSLLNLKYAGEKANSLLSPAITATALVAGYFVFEEHLSLKEWVGVLLTLLAVIYFLLQKQGTLNTLKLRSVFVSGMLTILFITLTIICSLKAIDSNLKLFQAIWLRLLIAFVIILPIAIKKLPKAIFNQPRKFYVVLCAAVLVQTILANYLWFYSSLTIGISLFQTILATLPLFVFATEALIFKKAKPSLSFFIVAAVALAGISLALII